MRHDTSGTRSALTRRLGGRFHHRQSLFHPLSLFIRIETGKHVESIIETNHTQEPKFVVEHLVGMKTGRLWRILKKGVELVGSYRLQFRNIVDAGFMDYPDGRLAQGPNPL